MRLRLQILVVALCGYIGCSLAAEPCDYGLYFRAHTVSGTERTIMALSMYFEPSDSSFYAVSIEKGGVLWKISMRDSVYRAVSKPIGNDRDYQDCDFSLYASPTQGKMYLVLDKILSDKPHDVALYSINMPLVDESDICQLQAKQDGRGLSRAALIALCALAMPGGGLWLLRRLFQMRQPQGVPAAAAGLVHQSRGRISEGGTCQHPINETDDEKIIDPALAYPIAVRRRSGR